jgi:hypothetical protein
MIPADEIPTTGGDAVIWAVCRAAAIERTVVILEDGSELPQDDQSAQIFLWNSNAAEQIEAAMAEIGYEIVKK